MLDDYTIFPVEVDVLDAAIMSFLENASYPDVTREKISAALITYTLHDSLGDYARVGIRKIDNEHSTLDFIQLPPQDGFLYEGRQIKFDIFSDKLTCAIASVYPKPPSAAPDAPTTPTSGAALGNRKGEEERTIDKPTTEYLDRLRQNIVDCFDESELRDLYFGMGIDYDNLPGQSKKDKARELVAHCKRTSRIRDLVAKCRELRPNVSWEGEHE